MTPAEIERERERFERDIAEGIDLLPPGAFDRDPDLDGDYKWGVMHNRWTGYRVRAEQAQRAERVAEAAELWNRLRGDAYASDAEVLKAEALTRTALAAWGEGR